METEQKKGMGCWKLGGLMLLTVIISVALTIWLMTQYLFPKQFDPVTLDQQEQSVLSKKLKSFGIDMSVGEAKVAMPEQLEPEPYTEEGAKREVSFTEKELNALLANNTDLADKVAIDLSDNLASAKVLFPLDPDFPILGGKTLKASAGMELAFRNNQPVVVLKGVSVWGVPVPNAWLGGLKNVDLVDEFGGQAGFWKSFAEGVDNISVQDGSLLVKLKE